MRGALIAALIALALPAAAQDASALLMVMGEDAAPVYNYLIAVDGSINGNDGTCSRTNILTADGEGWRGDFVRTSGDNIATPTTAGIVSNVSSYTLWMKRTGGAGQRGMFTQDRRFVVWSVSGTVWLTVPNVAGLAQSTASIVPFGTWTHVAIVWDRDADTVEFYFDGVFDKSVAFATQPQTSSTYATYMGSYYTSHTTFGFDGSLSNFRRYNRGISTNEITSLYDAGRHAPLEEISTSELVGFWSTIPAEQ